MRFRIVGNGAFGNALSKIFQKNMLIESSLNIDIKPILSSDILIPAVPSNAVNYVVEESLKFGKPKAIMLVSKGLATNNLLSRDIEYFNLPVLFFAGPNLAQEIMMNLNFISATIAGPENITLEIKSFLSDIILDTTTDLIFPEIASVMKNITAFLIGYLQPSENARATLIMEGIKEAQKLAKILGSSENNFLRACTSDFILTCTSENSRNFKAGKNFKENKKSNELEESLNSIEHVFFIKKDYEMPIIDFVYELVKKNNEDLTILNKINK